MYRVGSQRLRPLTLGEYPSKPSRVNPRFPWGSNYLQVIRTLGKRSQNCNVKVIFLKKKLSWKIQTGNKRSDFRIGTKNKHSPNVLGDNNSLGKPFKNSWNTLKLFHGHIRQVIKQSSGFCLRFINKKESYSSQKATKHIPL